MVGGVLTAQDRAETNTKKEQCANEAVRSIDRSMVKVRHAAPLLFIQFDFLLLALGVCAIPQARDAAA